MRRLDQQVEAATAGLNLAQFYYRRQDRSTRDRDLGVTRDAVVNALVNRCLSLVRSTLLLDHGGAHDDAYALCRVLFEAVLHLEFITRGNWCLRTDTYAHYLDAHFLRIRDEFFSAAEMSRISEAEWVRKAERVQRIFGKAKPSQWNVLPREHVLKPAHWKGIQGRRDLLAASTPAEYEEAHPREKDAPLPFWISWIWKHGSSYVHTDVASLDSAIRDLKGERSYTLRVPPSTSLAATEVSGIAVALHLSAIDAVATFIGYRSDRLDQLGRRWHAIMRSSMQKA